ncbi:hypothetical protein HYU12_02245 [Candidatus Woesearchaeota archaeon]|nr:hypothetical protein [Candidatus Woesearchaeota archaeon]
MGKKGEKAGKKENKAKTPESKRQTVAHNKTLLLPKQPALPELPAPEKKIKPKLRWLPFLRKKEKAKETPAIPEKITEAEPEFLKEIDTGQQQKTTAEPELSLWLNDGRIIKSISELRQALKTITNKTYAQHQEKNDISDWVRDIIGNAQLATELATAKNRKEALKIIEKSEGRQKQKTEPKKETNEIQQAIESLKRQKTKEETTEEREKKLREQERLLEMEEEHLNKKRIELANKRYSLLKETGELEKEKFEKLMSGHRKSFINPEKTGLKNLELNQEYTTEKIKQMIEETKKSLEEGQNHETQNKIAEIREAILTAPLTEKESKKLEYEILELEADAKLAALN